MSTRLSIDQVISAVRGLDGALVVAPAVGDPAFPELAWGDAFFYYAPDGQMPRTVQPYGTIVTKNYPDDTASDLDPAGRWRVNIHVDRATFRELTGDLGATDPASADPGTSPTSADSVTPPASADPATPETSVDPAMPPASVDPAVPPASVDPATSPTSVSPATPDVVLPHPVYASAGWVAVVNPGRATGDTVLRLLREAHDAARARYERRHGPED